MKNNIIIKFEDNRSIEVPYKTKIIDAVKLVQQDVSNILAFNINNEIKSYDYELVTDSNVEFVKLDSEDGYRVYTRTLKMILYMALTSLYSNADAEFITTINKDQYFIIKNMELTEEKINNIKNKMKEIINKDIPIVKRAVTLEEATVLYTASNNTDKLKNIDNKLKSYATIYFCDGMYNYFYGTLAPSTGYINDFNLVKYENGAILTAKNDNLEINTKEKSLYNAYVSFNELYENLGYATASSLNEMILKNKISEVIQTCEAIQQRKMIELVQDIESKKDIKMILIAGPSSSGKTTFAQRLGIQLKISGYNPITISMDNYFKERKDTPIDENGKYNFETVDAMDIDLFNRQMKDLIDGKTIDIPQFDFYEGVKKYKGNYLSLKHNDVLIIEGIHALNPIVTEFTPDSNKYKIYIAPITTLNIDGYTKVSSSDTRLLRRMVRDYTTRGNGVEKTFELWNNVKKGEEEYIFPFVNSVDYIFNSSLAYETNVIKTFAEPLLLQVERTSKYYAQARRLYSFLNNFLPMETTSIPIDSIIREFIGSGCFNR